MKILNRLLTIALGLFLISAGVAKFTTGHVFQYIEFKSGVDLFYPWCAARDRSSKSYTPSVCLCVDVSEQVLPDFRPVIRLDPRAAHVDLESSSTGGGAGRKARPAGWSRRRRWRSPRL